jgi:hypothetical protein
MLFRIGGHRHLEIAERLDACDEISRMGVAARMRLVARADPRRRIAAQGDDMANPGLPVGTDDRIDLLARCTDAGEMGGGTDVCLAHHARHGAVGPLTCGAAGAIGHRGKQRIERR